MPRIYDMKKAVLFLFVLCSNFLNAQDILDVMANESCNCIKNKKLDPKAISSEQFQMELGTCIVKSYSTYREEYKKINKSDYKDNDSMRKHGEDVAIKMFAICPEILMAMNNGDEEDIAAIEATTESLKIEGDVTDIVIKQFVTIRVKDKYRMVHDMILLDNFDTATLYTQGKIKKRDIISVSYSEVELFDPKAKEYRFYKIITGLEKK